MSELAAAAERLKSGDRVEVRVYLPRFGTLRVTGTARLRADQHTMDVSHYPLTVNGIPARNVLSMAILEERPG